MPRLVRSKLMRVRTNSPAAVKRAKQSATWSASTELPLRDPRELVEDDVRKAVMTGALVAVLNGASPKTTAAKTETPQAKSRTVRSGVKSNSRCAHAASARAPPSANSQPSSAPEITSRLLSVSSWRSSVLRCAPSAMRKLKSRWREALRATINMATLLHAIKRTRVTRAIRIVMGSR